MTDARGGSYPSEFGQPILQLFSLPVISLSIGLFDRYTSVWCERGDGEDGSTRAQFQAFSEDRRPTDQNAEFAGLQFPENIPDPGKIARTLLQADDVRMFSETADGFRQEIDSGELRNDIDQHRHGRFFGNPQIMRLEMLVFEDFFVVERSDDDRAVGTEIVRTLRHFNCLAGR